MVIFYRYDGLKTLLILTKSLQKKDLAILSLKYGIINRRMYVSEKKEEIKVISIYFYTFVLEDKNSGFCLHFIETISILYVLQFSKSGVLWRIGKNEIVYEYLTIVVQALLLCFTKVGTTSF